MKTHSFTDPHMVRSAKSLLHAWYITLGVFLGLFVLAHMLGSIYSSILLSRETANFARGIGDVTSDLKIKGDLLAKDPGLQQALAHNDRDTILSILTADSSRYGIPRLSVADAQGIVLSRSAYPTTYGDNVFLTRPAGRVVAHGSSTESIEMTGYGNQIFLTTARPVVASSTMIGALFANTFLDDSFAQHFRDQYLSAGTAVIFYSKEYGVYSNTFTDEHTRNLVESYFNSGSDWVQKGVSSSTINFGNGNIYVVKNIVFPGLEKAPEACSCSYRA